MTGTKLTLVPAQKQPVLIERGRIALFLVVMESYTIDYVNVRTVAESSTVSSKWEKVKKKKRLSRGAGEQVYTRFFKANHQ